MRIFFGLFVLIIFLSKGNLAEEEEVENFDDLFEDLENTYRRHPSVAVKWKLLGEKEGFVPVGQDVSVLMGVAHVGEFGEVQLTGVQCFLHAKHDFDYYLQNYTRTDLEDQLLKPGEEKSILYQFKVWERMPLAKYQVSGDVYYTFHRDLDEDRYMDKVFNETITLYNKDQAFDYQLVMMCIMIVGIVVAGFYIYGEARDYVDGQSRKTRKRHRD